MDAFEYAVALIAILVALAIGDMGMSLHKLIRCHRIVKWDARVAWAAALTFLTLFSMWFEFWGVQNLPEIRSYPFLLSLVVEVALLFMMATMVLPDEAGATTDLKSFYDDTSRQLWIFYILFQLSFFGHWLFFAFNHPRFTWPAFAQNAPLIMLPTLVGAILVVWSRKRLLHLVLVPLLIGFQLLGSWDNVMS